MILKPIGLVGSTEQSIETFWLSWRGFWVYAMNIVVILVFKIVFAVCVSNWIDFMGRGYAQPCWFEMLMIFIGTVEFGFNLHK